MAGNYTVKSVAAAGKYKVTDTIAVLTDEEGREHAVTMVQKWPVKQAVRCYVEKPRPSRMMETGVRAIDTFNPMAEGGTGFIPGPFGAGKTVLQHAISKQADADIIIMAVSYTHLDVYKRQAQTFDWKYDEARQTRPVSRPAPKMAAPCSSVIESVRKPLMMK